MRLLFLTFFAAITMSSCDELVIESPFKSENSVTYKIAQGAHDAGAFPQLFNDTHVVFKATFDESAQYETADPDNQGDINKLYGFSYCGDQHHVNSARFGWRWYQEELQIFAYTYLDGVRQRKFLSTVEMDESNTYEIEVIDHKYAFSINGQLIEEMPAKDCQETTNYYLFPYFGGDEVAPHDIVIEIEVVE